MTQAVPTIGVGMSVGMGGDTHAQSGLLQPELEPVGHRSQEQHPPPPLGLGMEGGVGGGQESHTTTMTDPNHGRVSKFY